MNLFDLIKPKNNNVNTEPLQLVQAVPNAQGGLDAQVTQWQPRPTKMQNFKNKLADMLLGEAAPATDNIGLGDGKPITMKDEITGEQVTYTPQNVSTISQNPRVGGLFRDIGAGARENFVTGFAANNLLDNETADGRKKGFAYRLGEGLGSVGRFLESSPGRGLLTAAAVGLAGGNGADMLAYGIQGGSLNNRLRTQDRMYREEMLRNYINSLQNSPEFANMTPEEQRAVIEEATNQVNNMRGYVTDDLYKNFVNAQQLRDNADWKRLYFNNQQEQNKIMNQLRQDQLEFQKIKAAEDRDFKTQQLASDNAYKNAQLGLGYARLNESREARLSRAQTQNKIDKTLTDNMQTLADIDAGLQSIRENPSAYSWLKGKMGADLANRIDPKGVKTRTQIDNITAVYRKWLTGAQMSDQERKAYERFLPAPSDNANIVINKLQGMRDSIERKNQVIMQNANINANMAVDSDPLGLGI